MEEKDVKNPAQNVSDIANDIIIVSFWSAKRIFN